MRILFSAPPEMNIDHEPVDLAFEIAFHKAGVLIAKYQPNGLQGSVQDLVSLLEEAKRLGERRIREHRLFESGADFLELTYSANAARSSRSWMKC